MKLKGHFFGQNAVDGNAGDYGGWWGVLSGCVPDARDLAMAFADIGYTTTADFSGYNVAGASVPWILTLDCTRDAWRALHTDLQAEAQLGDTYIIGNSGHGGTYPTAGAPGQTLCFADGMIEDGEFFDMMRAWPAGVRVAYILDTCYSGGMDRDRLRAPIRAAPKWVSDRSPMRAQRPAMKSSDIQAQVIQLCACQWDQTASDGPHNGAFTGSLLAIWQQARQAARSITWREWMRATTAIMRSAFPDQVPELNVLGAGSAMVDEAVW